MSKTSFSKSELINLYHILLKKKMLPCDKICVWFDPFNSGKINYTIMKFAKGKKQLDICLLTKTHPRTHKLEEQLIKYFGVEE